jgi:hypothetical protein
MKGPGMSEVTPVAMTEDQVKSLIEAAEQKTAQAYEARITATETEAKQAKEEAKSLRDEATTKAFREEITGRSTDNDKGAYVFSGEYGEDYLKILRALPDDLRETYKTIERRKAGSFAELMKVAGKETGSDARGDASDSAETEATQKARVLATEKGLTFYEAYEKVIQDPDLNRRIAAESKGR